MPEDEEKEILKRWYGHWKLIDLGSAGRSSIWGPCGSMLAVDGFVLGMATRR